MPFFSIIMPVFNREQFLLQAYQSVLNQSFKDWELIIVDDGSKDSSWVLIEAIKDPRVIKIRQNNKGAGAARNTGIINASGKYIAFLDSDDLWLPIHLEKHFEKISAEKLPKAIFHSFLITCEQELEIGRQALVNEATSDSLDYIRSTSIYPTSTVISKVVLIDNLFNEEIKASIDAECFFRIAAKYPIFPIPLHTAILRRHESNLTVKSINTYLNQILTLSKMSNYKIFKGRLSKSYFNKIISNYYFYAAMETNNILVSYRYFFLSVRYNFSKCFSRIFIKSFLKRHTIK